jgi:exosortase/archaeosortase family protein
MNLRKSFIDITGHFTERTITGTFYRLGLFIFLYTIWRLTLMHMEDAGFFRTGFTFMHELLSAFICKVSVFVFRVVYPTITTTSYHLICINDTGTLRLYPGCSGLQPLLWITFILAFYPIKIKTKLWLFPVSWLIILVATMIHFMMLIPIAYDAPSWFPLSHKWFSRVMFYGLFFLVWVLWENISFKPLKKIKVKAND